MPQRLPLLVQMAFATERVRLAVERLQFLLSEEVLLAWTPSQQREAINQIVYSGKDMYLPGGWFFEQGLAEWERIALSTPPFPAGGRILLGGAGGGRELHGLCGLGYDVVAFEPSERLCEGARRIVSAYPNSTVVRASYGDLVTAAEQRTGPLAAHVLDSSFSAVFFGTTSFNYVFTGPDREAVLRATSAIAPRAPLLIGFIPQNMRAGRIERLRPAIRRLFALLRAPSYPSPGDRFASDAGFIHDLTLDEVRTTADRSGYRIVHFSQNGVPHALLMPL